jgi:hypothetical protein
VNWTSFRKPVKSCQPSYSAACFYVPTMYSNIATVKLFEELATSGISVLSLCVKTYKLGSNCFIGNENINRMTNINTPTELYMCVSLAVPEYVNFGVIRTYKYE